MRFPRIPGFAGSWLLLCLAVSCSKPPEPSNPITSAPPEETKAGAGTPQAPAIPPSGPPLQPTLPAEPEPLPSNSYRVCSYNVRNWCVTDRMVNGRHEDAAPKPDPEKKAVLGILAKLNPDILAVEEMGADPAMASDFIQALEQAGLTYPHTLHAAGLDKRICILLLSRYPFVESSAVAEVQENGQPVGFRPGRPFAAAAIAVNDHYRLELIAAHLKSKRGTDTGPSEAEIRLGEARALRALMDQKLRSNPDTNLLVVGDMNDFWQSPPLKALMGEGNPQSPRIFDLWLRDYLGDRWTHFYTPEQTYARLDYMLASRGLFQEYMAEHSYVYREERGNGPSQQWANASDHRPILATFHATDQSSPP